MKYNFKKTLFLLFGFTLSLLTSAQELEIRDLEADEVAVKNLVEQFLITAGSYDLETMPKLFTENANIGGASYKNGQWTTFTMTFTEFLESLKSRQNPTGYNEPVSKFTVHIDGGMLAFVKADAVLIKNEKPLSNNFDYFTLLKVNGEWKILNGSYVSIPIEN